MADELALNLAMERGARAEVLLRDELLVEAFTALERDYIEAWRASRTDDTAGRERLWLAIRTVEAVRRHLQQVAADGVLAQHELHALRKI